MNFIHRLYKKEQLDNLSLSGKSLHKTLVSLKWINSLFGNHRLLKNSVLDYCVANPDQESFRIIDLGCGGGDSMFSISKALRKKNINVSLTGIDGNPQSIAFAQSKNTLGYNFNFITADILSPDFSIPDTDILISSHFIYHFKDEDLILFLKKIQQKSIKHIIFSELYRSKIAYYLFKFFNIISPISSIAKKDGLIAIQRAFTIQELRMILKKSHLKNVTIHKKPWFRTLIKIDL